MWIAIAGLVLVLGVLAFWFSKDATGQAKELVAGTPVLPLAQAAANPVGRVTGKVLDRELALQAPLSGVSCAWYNVTVEELDAQEDHESWNVVFAEERGADFVLDDGTAQASIRMTGARVHSLSELDAKSGTLQNATPAQVALLTRNNQKPTNFVGMNRQLRYREAVIRAGESVTVLGRVRSVDGAPGKFEVVAPEGGQLFVSDDPAVVA